MIPVQGRHDREEARGSRRHSGYARPSAAGQAHLWAAQLGVAKPTCSTLRSGVNHGIAHWSLGPTHRFPVTVYVLEGTFTLELEGRAPVTAKAGQAMVEPPLVKMTGYNRSGTEPLRVVIFYVSDPDTPFLDSVHH